MKFNEPAVHQNASAPLATPDELFGALLKLSSLVERGVTPFRMFCDGRLLPYADSFPYRPLERHKTLRGYIVETTERIGAFGIIANYVQQLSDAIGSRIRAFIEPLRFSGTVQADAFIGSYSRGFFGLHKDEFDVFTFPVLGVKQYLTWPFEAFEHLQGSQRYACYSQATDLNYNSARSSAVVLEPDVSQYAYWPAPIWHVVESQESAHASIGIGVRP